MPDRVEAKLTRYRLLVDLMAELVSTQYSEDVLRVLHRRVGTLFDAPVTLLAILQPDESWQCLTLEGQKTYRKILYPQSDGLLERVIAGTLTYTNDLFNYAIDSNLTLRSLDPEAALPYTYSWMGVPLQLHNHTQGVLSIQSYAQNDFSDDDLELLQLLGTHLSIAIENALLREQLEVEARTDTLTGLGNRRAFMDRSEAALHTDSPLSLAVMDVEKFKRINDELGHPAGDSVLACIGTLLQQHVLADAQAFRLGGDEFALLYWLPLQQAQIRLQTFLLAVRDEAWPVPFPVRLNAGLAEHRPGDDFELLVRNADRRMYAAKARGTHLDLI